MTTAEHIYRILLWLYPAQHRKVYGPSMLQHAHDLSRVAQQRGRWHLAALWLRLMIDGILNAVIEHREAIMTAKRTVKPVPWLSVLLSIVPGLWIALSRRHADVLGPLLLILGGGYILLIVLGLPAIWWRKRQFPVWALLFVGMLTWLVPYKARTELLPQMSLPNIFSWETGIALLIIALTTTLFVVLLRGQHLPGSVWAFIGFMLLVNILGATIYLSIWLENDLQIRDLLPFLLVSLALLADGLMLVAVGLLAARRHGVLALLFIIGGYSYLFLDNDYLFGYPSRDWSGLPLYLITMSLLYLVLTPIALLRAKTRLGRALALFGPVLLFLILRLIVPILATGQSFAMLRLGDVGISLNILFTLMLAWVLYSYIGNLSQKAENDNHEPSPIIISII